MGPHGTALLYWLTSKDRACFCWNSQHFPSRAPTVGPRFIWMQSRLSPANMSFLPSLINKSQAYLASPIYHRSAAQRWKKRRPYRLLPLPSIPLTHIPSPTTAPRLEFMSKGLKREGRKKKKDGKEEWKDRRETGERKWAKRKSFCVGRSRKYIFLFWKCTHIFLFFPLACTKATV